jgi:exodeoxyribonuclease VII small subunit
MDHPGSSRPDRPVNINVLQEAEKKPSFEKRLADLNDLIKQLERGDLGLEDAIRTFERGKKLHGELASQLAEFERRIEILTRDLDGQDRVEPAPEFDPDRKHDHEVPF